MPGSLDHSPTEIIRRLLIAKGWCTEPSSDLTWPAFAFNEPSSPDGCITVRGTAGRTRTRIQHDGSQDEEYGFQVRVRATDEDTGDSKAREISIGMDTQVYRDVLLIDSATYCIHCISRTSDVIPLGLERSPSGVVSQRSIFVINAMVWLEQIS